VLHSYGIPLAGVYQKYSNPTRIVKGVHSMPRLPLFGMQIAGAALGGVLGATLGLRVTLLPGGLGLVVAHPPPRALADPAYPRSRHHRGVLGQAMNAAAYFVVSKPFLGWQYYGRAVLLFSSASIVATALIHISPALAAAIIG